ncbi:unnamed protein product [Microthlaspi erraticum]|uniref:Cystatin domain-containing protein n=1 Tax=Microthlaspi erraticum TaxID=1685480 RepID=A0A6D2LD00_9BRAS|nr:unnamed protein product [Microthlaspi erraticum]
MADVDNSIDSRDSNEPKIETDSEDEAEIDGPPRGSFLYKGKLLRPALSYDDLECDKQRDLFYKQLADSEGFDVEWDRFDYVFNVVNFDWKPCIDDNRSNEEDTRLESVKYVSANIVSVKGLLYFITFWATDVLSSDLKPKLYQAKVSRYCQEMTVLMVRLKPTQ